ncbi:MAG: hypothetical protein JRI76_03820 [Deltaproteobacteria bacterium]|nr:hypothetical protein [Deltaproteobacteria bacterium]MBW2041142.1 hypothetical protein [Deltaproteobacteria bacterium]MBW2131926.1 hypothetical protein [Deltaproteobacteria bacterium]
MHITKMETLHEACRLSVRNGGAPGIDGVTFDAVDASGRKRFLEGTRREPISGAYTLGKTRTAPALYPTISCFALPFSGLSR